MKVVANAKLVFDDNDESVVYLVVECVKSTTGEVQLIRIDNYEILSQHKSEEFGLYSATHEIDTARMSSFFLGD